jgi:hypothetical protein
VKDSTGSQNKTGGFVTKKKANKILASYLEQKEEFDRKALVKTVLDNNKGASKGKPTERRKSANAGTRQLNRYEQE